MNWTAIGAIGEIVGVFAVIITLLYLVREVRLNARSLSMSALRDTTTQWNQWSEMLATSESLAVVVAKGNARYEELDDVERLRYGAYIQSFFDNAESYRSLIIDYETSDDLEILDAIVSRRLQIPGFHAWWRENHVDYNLELQNWVDTLVRQVQKQKKKASE